MGRRSAWFPVGTRWLTALVLAGATLAHAQRNLEVSAKSTEPRVALIIGNAQYGRGPLRNPVNDARAISTRLERLGFVVIKRENLRAREIGSTLREFRSRLSPGAVALFFYAGHGVQIRGVNYLPTVDAEIDAEEDVPTQSIDLGKVLEVMEDAKARVNLVFLDACRDNPFARKFRSASNGLAKVDAPSGTLIAFATRPGSVAADGDGMNGLYTQYLLRHMDEPDLPIEQLLKRVGRSVKLASKGKQEPWSEGLIEGDFYFRTALQGPSRPAASEPAVPQMDATALEAMFWDSIKASTIPEDFKAYLQQYPQGRFTALAENRLKVLTAPQAPRPPASAEQIRPATQLAMVAPASLRSLSIGTGGTGGVYYPLGGGIANLLSRNIRGLNASAEVTGGSVANLQLIGTGRPYLGMTMSDATLDAYRGEGRFSGKSVPVRTLVVMYPNRMHIVTLDSIGIRSVADLRGRRVSTGSGGSATEVMAFRILEAVGIDKDQGIRRERLGVAESMTALRNRQVDAAFWLGGVPTAAVTDLASSGVRIRMVEHGNLVPEMNRRYGGIYVQETMPGSSYPGLESDYSIASVMNLLVAHESLDETMAYNIVKTVLERRSELVSVHREAENIRLEWQSTGATPIPFHPGAVRYYLERGIALR